MTMVWCFQSPVVFFVNMAVIFLYEIYSRTDNDEVECCIREQVALGKYL